MPLSPETKAEIEAYVASIIRKVRVPELAPHSIYGELSLLDQVPIYMHSVNKTVRTDLQVLKQLIDSGATGSIVPALIGAPIIHEVTAAEAGGIIINEPSLAGKTFFLRLEGRPFDVDEYEVLHSGGAKITIPGYELQYLQRFDLQVFELTASGGPVISSVGSFINGTKIVSTNYLVSPINDIGKLIQIRAVGASVVITLPDIDLVPANTIIPIEATINNTKQHKIIGTSGQYFYLNNESYTHLGLGVGETLWLFRDDAGWIVLNDSFSAIYLALGKPQTSYKIGLNEAICKGQLVSRIEYARLWETVQTFGTGLVDDVLWNKPSQLFQGQEIERPYRAFWSTGNGIDTFRLPDLQNLTVRGLIQAGDPNRFYNSVGSYQPDTVGPHEHLVYGQDNDSVVTGAASPELANVQNPTDPTAHQSRKTSIHNPNGETSGKNVGLFYVVKY